MFIFENTARGEINILSVTCDLVVSTKHNEIILIYQVTLKEYTLTVS